MCGCVILGWRIGVSGVVGTGWGEGGSLGERDVGVDGGGGGGRRGSVAAGCGRRGDVGGGRAKHCSETGGELPSVRKAKGIMLCDGKCEGEGGRAGEKRGGDGDAVREDDRVGERMCAGEERPVSGLYLAERGECFSLSASVGGKRNIRRSILRAARKNSCEGATGYALSDR